MKFVVTCLTALVCIAAASPILPIEEHTSTETTSTKGPTDPVFSAILGDEIPQGDEESTYNLSQELGGLAPADDEMVSEIDDDKPVTDKPAEEMTDSTSDDVETTTTTEMPTHDLPFASVNDGETEEEQSTTPVMTESTTDDVKTTTTTEMPTPNMTFSTVNDGETEEEQSTTPVMTESTSDDLKTTTTTEMPTEYMPFSPVHDGETEEEQSTTPVTETEDPEEEIYGHVDVDNTYYPPASPPPLPDWSSHEEPPTVPMPEYPTHSEQPFRPDEMGHGYAKPAEAGSALPGHSQYQMNNHHGPGAYPPHMPEEFPLFREPQHPDGMKPANKVV